MAFLRSSIGQDSALIVRGRGVWLRPAVMGDYGAWAELRARSREHLVPWEPLWQRDELTRSAFRRRVRHYQREAREDLGYSFLIFERRRRRAARRANLVERAPRRHSGRRARLLARGCPSCSAAT